MTRRTDTQEHEFFATCPRNTEGLLLDELVALEIPAPRETRAGVAFRGPISSAYKACLWSRVASRVLLRLGSFPVSDPDDLYEGIAPFAWEDHVAPQGTIAVEVTSVIRQGPLATLNTHYAEQRVKDAVVDRFRARTGERPGVDLARPHVRINVHLVPDEAVVSIDLAGDSLHRRGYRQEGGEAPLKENLAAAILLRAGWPRIAETGGALLDPMCGSGTLLVEGSFMAADIAPGLEREYYGFLRWSGFDPRQWAELTAEARERRAAGLERLPTVLGFDADPRAVGLARANVRRAGLAGRVLIERRELSDLVAPELPVPAGTKTRPGAAGLVVTNPPYGKRLGDMEDLIPLYERLGERLKLTFTDWETAVFTGNPELGAHLGLRAHRTNTLYNGPLACRLLQFKIGPAAHEPRTGSAPTGRGPAHGQTAAPKEDLEGDSAGAQMFANRLRKNAKHLRRWASREGIGCYRVYDADLPEYAAAIDLYADWAHIQEYEPPRSVDPVRARRRLKEILAVTPEALGLPVENVVLKVRRRQRGTDQYQKLDGEGRMIEVGEGGLRFLVNLTDYLDTGLFLDHRITRGMIRDLADGRRFLNLFAYTGAATVYAAAGGAASTATVDLSSTYLEWARRNLELNGITGPAHGFVRADCLEWLAAAASGGGEYDLIFLDPPVFSNSKSMTDTLDIQRDHPGLIRAAARLLSPEGILLFSTNLRRFKLDPALAVGLEVADITKQTIPPDFARNPRIHSCFRITKVPAR